MNKITDAFDKIFSTQEKGSFWAEGERQALQREIVSLEMTCEGWQIRYNELKAENKQILLDIRSIVANPKRLGYRLTEIEEYIDNKLAQGRG